jgi:phosphoglycolate phosphatase
MEQDMLMKQIKEQEVTGFFDDITGLKDIYAHSKLNLAQEYVISKKLNPTQILFIGDTLHDAEVANKLGCQLILVANGHHGEARLKQICSRVAKNLQDLVTLLP